MEQEGEDEGVHGGANRTLREQVGGKGEAHNPGPYTLVRSAYWQEGDRALACRGGLYVLKLEAACCLALSRRDAMDEVMLWSR